MVRKRAAIGRIHLQKENQKLLWLLISHPTSAEMCSHTPRGSRSTAVRPEQRCSSLLHHSGDLVYLQKCSIFTAQAKIRCFPAGSARLQMLLENQVSSSGGFWQISSLGMRKSKLKIGCSEMSEKFQKTWRSWNPEKNHLKCYSKLFSISWTSAAISWLQSIHNKRLTGSSQPPAAFLLIDYFCTEPVLIHGRNKELPMMCYSL